MKSVLSALIVLGLTIGLACSDNQSITNGDQTEITAQPVPSDIGEYLDVYGVPSDGSYDETLIGPEFEPPPLSDTSYDAYAVTLIWGNPSALNTDAFSEINWAGTLTLAFDGWVVPIRPIMFEPDEDRILDNPSPTMAAWESKTHGGLDGISFVVYIKRGVTVAVIPTLTFETKPISQTWDIGQFKEFSALYKTDAGNILAIEAHRIIRTKCPDGILNGKWVRDAKDHRVGQFEGLWYENSRTPIGTYVGKFWWDESGIGRFQGSVSGYLTDQVIAEFEGEWYFTDFAMCITCGDRFGVFKGRVKWLDRDAVGELWGEFGDISLDPSWIDSAEGVPMVGNWRVNCISTDVAPQAGFRP